MWPPVVKGHKTAPIRKQQKGPLEQQKMRSALRAQSSTKELFPQRSMRRLCGAVALLSSLRCVCQACVCVCAHVMKCGYCCCCCAIITKHVTMTQQIPGLTPPVPSYPPTLLTSYPPTFLPSLPPPLLTSYPPIFHCCKFLLTSVSFYHPLFSDEVMVCLKYL